MKLCNVCNEILWTLWHQKHMRATEDYYRFYCGNEKCNHYGKVKTISLDRTYFNFTEYDKQKESLGVIIPLRTQRIRNEN